MKFCPTYMVTGQVFRSIYDGSSNFQLLKGRYQIGKTYSMRLYVLLSEMIFRYRHKYCKKMQDLPEGINRNLPKAFYWASNSLSYHPSPAKIIEKLIEDNLYELKSFGIDESTVTGK